MLLGLLGLALVLTLQFASAYGSYYEYSPHASVYYNEYDGASVYLSLDDHDYYDHFYVDAPYTRYMQDRYYNQRHSPYRYSRYNEREAQVMNTLRYVSKDYEQWKEDIEGKTSEEVYYPTTKTKTVPSTNFRNKNAYIPTVSNKGNSKNYYYKPIYDKALGYFNFRY